MAVSFENHPRYDNQYQRGYSNPFSTGDGTKGTQNAGGAAGSQSVTNGSFVNSGDGIVSSGKVTQNIVIATNAPEMEPGANVTNLEQQEHYTSILTKLDASRGNAFKGRSIMFDIYAMMDLIQEMSQKMRNALRELRKLENNAIYCNIKAQAQIQRQAATQAMIAGAVMCALQAAGMIASMAGQLKGLSQNKAMKFDSGAATLEKLDKMTANLGNQSGAAKQLQMVQGRTPGMSTAEVMPNTSKAVDTALSSSPEVQAAESDLNAAKTSLADKQAGLAKLQGQTNADPTALKNAQSMVKYAEGNVAKCETNLAKAKQSAMSSSGVLDATAQDVKTAQTEFVQARNDYSLAQETVESGKPLPEGTTLEGLEAKFKSAAQKYEVAQANQIKIVTDMNLSPTELADVKSYIQGAIKDVNPIDSSSSFMNLKGQSLIIKGMLFQQVAQLVGQFGQQVVQGVKEIQQSKATELQAEQKLLEEQFDQIKDLFALQQDVIRKSIDIFAGIIQKESSIIEQIFQHI